MRLNDLERALASVPPHPEPKVELEQYATPADVAAPLLFEAWSLGDIEGKRVLDLGSGTGILAIGASLLGAAEVTGVDLDRSAIDTARFAAERLGADARFVEADVRAWQGRADTVVMNPPFGAQVEGADRVFLDVAMRSAGVVYSMHNAVTRDFVETYAKARGFAVTHRWHLRVSLKHQYRHHTRAAAEIGVLAIRLTQSR